MGSLTRPNVQGLSKDVRADQAHDARSGLFVLEKALGMSVEAIANKYRAPESVVEQAVRTANFTGLLTAYRDILIQRLVPHAMGVYEARLMRGDLKAAQDILYGLGILTKEPQAIQLPVGDSVETLAVYRKLRNAHFDTHEGSAPGVLDQDGNPA